MKLQKERDDKLQKRVDEMTYLEEFMNSDYYENFYKKFLVNLIDEYTNNILNDESPESFKPQYGMKEVNLKVRKILIGLYNNPRNTLKQLQHNTKQIFNNTAE